MKSSSRRPSNWLRALIALGALPHLAPAALAEQPKAVLELFTSQGCSSCPSADRLFEPLAGRSDVITLSLNVDYWDRLGWKDTLAKPAFTARQRAYADARGDGEVYTPQAVLNGRSHFVGSNSAKVNGAVSGRAGFSAPIDVVKTAGSIEIAIGAAATPAVPATVLALSVVSERVVAIGHGENANRSVTYTNVVRGIDTVGSWTGAETRLSLAPDRYTAYDSLVVLVQSGTADRPGPILGAARVQLR